MPQLKIENQNLLIGIVVFALFLVITLFLNAAITFFFVIAIILIAVIVFVLKAWFDIDVIKIEKTEKEKEEIRRRG